MAHLLWFEAISWVVLLLVALITLLVIGQTSRRAVAPSRERAERLRQIEDGGQRLLNDERTRARWARVVKQSNTAFWTYVSNRSEYKR